MVISVTASRSQWDVVVLELLGILEASPPGAKDDRASEAANASREMDNTCGSRKFLDVLASV